MLAPLLISSLSQKDDASRMGRVWPQEMWEDMRRYELDVQQQPRLAYLSEANTKAGRRPLDPPPVIRLRSRPTRRSRLDSADDSSSEEDFDFDRSNLSQITHRLFLFAALLPEQAATEETYATRNDLVAGTVFSSLSYLRGQNCFAFPDLNILAEGRWRLCMSLFELTRSGVRFQTSTMTEPFEVFAQERFPLLTTTCETFQKIVAKEAQKSAEELSNKPTKDSPAGPPKRPRKPRAPSTSSLAERTVRPSHTSLTHIPYQRKPRPQGPGVEQGGAQDLPTGAGNFKRYPRLQPDRIFQPESLDNDVTRRTEVPSRRIVSAAAAPSQPRVPPRDQGDPYSVAPASVLHGSPAQYTSRLASVHNPTLPRPRVPNSSILPPIHASRSYPSVLQARPRRAVSASQAIATSPSGASAMATSLSTPGVTTSPTSSFADLLAAAAVVEQRESVRAERVLPPPSASCICQPNAPEDCAVQVDIPAKHAGPFAAEPTAPSPPPTSRSLSRLLGEVKDAKLFETDHAGTPMFL